MFIVFTLLITSGLVAGCGISQEQHEVVVADLGKAQGELESAKTDLGKAQEESESAKTDLGKAQGELESAKTDLGKAQEELESAKTDLGKAQGELGSLSADLKAVNMELVELNKVYPPRDFSSLRELREWLVKNDVSGRPVSTMATTWYSKALEIQEDALRDGFVISVDEDSDEEGNAWVFCVTIINGEIWYWDPETDEPIQDDSWGKVK
ncbi:hypothetical protein ACFLYV_03680 [Chloroflexota bacterium]